MKTFYVYSISDPISKQPFYIGKGTFKRGISRRWVSHIREAEKWTPGTRVTNTNKTKMIKEILNVGLVPLCQVIFESKVETDVLLEEQRLISLYGRIVDGTGILTNLIEGGSGFRNYTEQMKTVRSLLNKGSNNPMFGKNHSKLSKEKIRKARLEKIRTGKIIPTKHTEEWKQHLRENNPGGQATSKQIYQIDVFGNIIKTWRSSRHAGISLNIKTWRNISHAANKTKTHTVGGFYWRWVGDSDIVKEKLANIIELNKIRTDRSLKSSKPVQQIDPTNPEKGITIWKSQCEAARQLKIDNAGISKAILDKKIYKGSIWRFV